MKIFICVSIAALFCGSNAQELSKKFKKEKVVSDVLSKVPAAKLKVEYVDEDISADLGNTLGVSNTQSIPKVSYEAADEKKMYTLAMVDPDAPSREDPKAAQWLHWLVVNVPGKNMKSGENIDYGKVLMQHNGPAPPKGSGPHRYVFVVYEQRRPVNARVSRNRAGFKVESFAKRSQLGDPVAGNFYYAENN